MKKYNLPVKYLIHLLFWGLFFFISVYTFHKHHDNLNVSVKYFTLILFITYLNELLLLPYLVKRERKYLLYFLVIVFVCFCSTIIYCKYILSCSCSLNNCIYFYFWKVVFPVIFLSLLWIFLSFIQKQKEIEEIKQQHLETELKFLKSQINPHVLFNNLNTIYSYSLEKSENVSQMILMLSDNLKYILYQSNTKFVSLKQELKFINNYMAFQQLRTEGTKKIMYKKSVDSLTYQIAPLLLIDIIENAFKHSTYKQDELNPIEITLKVKEGNLSFSCKNETLRNKSGNDEKIGLSNLQKRLNLLYPNKHKLSIVNNGKEFLVNLFIELL